MLELTCQIHQRRQTRAESGRNKGSTDSGGGTRMTRTHMKRIEIAIQPVQRSLRIRRLLLKDSVRLTFGWIVPSRSGTSIYFFPRKISSTSCQNISGRSQTNLFQHAGRQILPIPG